MSSLNLERINKDESTVLVNPRQNTKLTKITVSFLSPGNGEQFGRTRVTPHKLQHYKTLTSFIARYSVVSSWDASMGSSFSTRRTSTTSPATRPWTRTP